MMTRKSNQGHHSRSTYCSTKSIAGHGAISSNQLDLAWSPRLIEERFERAIETQEGKVTLSGHGLDPVAALDPLGLFGSEVDRRGTVSVRLGGGGWIAMAAGAWVALRGVEH